jgi:hypothetical protein
MATWKPLPERQVLRLKEAKTKLEAELRALRGELEEARAEARRWKLEADARLAVIHKLRKLKPHPEAEEARPPDSVAAPRRESKA